MNRSRLLLVVPTATALVFTGLSPAWAGGGDHGHDDDAWARVISIDDEAEYDDDNGTVQVKFEYKCDDDDDDDEIKAEVTLRQDGDDVRYEGDSEDLNCNGEKNEEEVDLEKKNGDDVENGRARVTVRIVDGDDRLDRERERVDVEGVDDNGDKDHEH